MKKKKTVAKRGAVRDKRFRFADKINLLIPLVLLLLGLPVLLFLSQNPQDIRQKAQTAIWVPPPNTTWQWQLTGNIDTSVDAAVYDIDWEVDASVVQTLHSQGKKVICYLSVGSFEDWRPDAGSFPAQVKGAAYEGWPGEWWLDIRSDTVKQIMAARMDTCKQKGFDAIEPDNMDVPSGNGSGFPLTNADELNYANWLAQEAHKRGMSIGIKNTGSQAQALVQNFDFAVVEECFEFNECDQYTPFIQANKAVFEAEYNLATSAFCSQAKQMKISAIKKNLNLDAPREACPLDPPLQVTTNPTSTVTATSIPAPTMITPTLYCLGPCVTNTPTTGNTPTQTPTAGIQPTGTEPTVSEPTEVPEPTAGEPTPGLTLAPTIAPGGGGNNGGLINTLFQFLLSIIMLLLSLFRLN